LAQGSRAETRPPSSNRQLTAMAAWHTLLFVIFPAGLTLHVDLTQKNFNEAIEGKNALLWFLAPW